MKKKRNSRNQRNQKNLSKKRVYEITEDNYNSVERSNVDILNFVPVFKKILTCQIFGMNILFWML